MIELVDLHNMGKVNKYLENYITNSEKKKYDHFKLTKDEFRWYIKYLKKYENKTFLKDYRILHVGDSETHDFILDYECENIFEALDAHYIHIKEMSEDNKKKSILLPHFIVYPLGTYFDDYKSIVFSFEFKVVEGENNKDTK